MLGSEQITVPILQSIITNPVYNNYTAYNNQQAKIFSYMHYNFQFSYSEYLDTMKIKYSPKVVHYKQVLLY